jgi:signal transduction histidine kinase/DNA-binding response OmpR family regulator
MKLAGVKSPTGRLSRKYALVMAVLISGALLVSGLLQLAFSYQESSASLSRVEHEKAATAATRITDFIVETMRQISWTIRPAGAAPEQRSDDYLRLLRIAPAITDVRYIDAAGLERLSISRVALNALDTQADWSASPAFLGARGGATYFGPVYYRTESEPYITIALAESSAGGGVTVAEVNLKFIWDVIRAITISEQGYAYVVDGSGQLIAHRDISRVLRRSDYSVLPQVQLAQATGAPAMASNAQPATVAVNPEGTQVLTAFEMITPTCWWVFVEQPLEEAFAPMFASLIRTGVFVLVGLVLSIVASMMLARRMVRPIKALEAGATRIGAGALDQRIEVRTGDELEALAEAFNRMAEQLADSRADLENKVTERTRELVSALHELENASQHKSEFLASMSHELRTPLNAVIGFSEMLSHGIVGPLNDKQHEYVDDVLTSGRHLLSLINDMLDLAKIEAGKTSLERTTFSLPEVIELTVDMMGETATRRGLSLDVDIDPRVALVSGDERKIKQVLINLFANAIKFTPEAGHVTVQARRLGDEVAVSVRDTGIGLEEEDQLRIFDAFQQANAAKGRFITRPEGTGLGLTLAKKFVDLHGGRIWVESSPGQGSTFTFVLPLLPARPRPTSVEEAPPRITGQGPTVLLIEDDPKAVELLSVYLREAGFSVAAVEGAEHAMRLATDLHPVAITLDILLPGSELDGWDLLGKLKTSPTTACIPVIVVSIVDEPGKGFALGAADYLVKPVRRDALLGTMDRLGLSGGSRVPPATVLIVEADQEARRRIAENMFSVGYAATEAASGEEGVRLARGSVPDMVILDLLLPDIDGLAVAEAIRSQPATRPTPILMLTPPSVRPEEKAHLRDRIEYLAQGTDFDKDTFLRLVRRLRPEVPT